MIVISFGNLLARRKFDFQPIPARVRRAGELLGETVTRMRIVHRVEAAESKVFEEYDRYWGVECDDAVAIEDTLDQGWEVY